MKALLTINVAVYVLWALILVHIPAVRAFVYNFVALNPEVPLILFRPWQMVSYNFIHLGVGFFGFLHLAFNMLWLYCIGKEYEELNGSHRLLSIYLLGGLGGGLLTVLFYSLAPGSVIVDRKSTRLNSSHVPISYAV